MNKPELAKIVQNVCSYAVNAGSRTVGTVSEYCGRKQAFRAFSISRQARLELAFWRCDG